MGSGSPGCRETTLLAHSELNPAQEMRWELLRRVRGPRCGFRREPLRWPPSVGKSERGRRATPTSRGNGWCVENTYLSLQLADEQAFQDLARLVAVADVLEGLRRVLATDVQQNFLTTAVITSSAHPCHEECNCCLRNHKRNPNRAQLVKIIHVAAQNSCGTSWSC